MPASSGPRVAVCPGSFDPVTVGHVDVVRRASGLFDVVVAAVVRNYTKATLFDAPERADLLREALRADPALAVAAAADPGPPAPAAASAEVATRAPGVRVEVVEDGLLVDYARRLGAVAIVKGLRSGTDFAYEVPMALMNRHLSGVETVFVPGDPRYGHISSSMVKEVARLGGDVTGLVPDPVLRPLLERLGATSQSTPHRQ